MAAVFSRPGGDRLIGWKTWALAALTVWLGAIPAGLAVLLVAYPLSAVFGLTNSDAVAHPLAALYVVGYLLFFSPLLSWAGILLALPFAWLALRRGIGGWVVFALLGVVAGSVASGFFEHFADSWGGAAAGLIHGLLSALAFRWLLARLQPDAFTDR